MLTDKQQEVLDQIAEYAADHPGVFTFRFSSTIADKRDEREALEALASGGHIRIASKAIGEYHIELL